MRSTNLVQTDDIGVLEQLQCRDLPPYLHTYAGDGEETNSHQSVEKRSAMEQEPYLVVDSQGEDNGAGA
jgi:hypothetical protein